MKKVNKRISSKKQMRTMSKNELSKTFGGGIWILQAIGIALGLKNLKDAQADLKVAFDGFVERTGQGLSDAAENGPTTGGKGQGNVQMPNGGLPNGGLGGIWY